MEAQPPDGKTRPKAEAANKRDDDFLSGPQDIGKGDTEPAKRRCDKQASTKRRAETTVRLSIIYI